MKEDASSASSNDVTIVPSIKAGVESNSFNIVTDSESSMLEEIVSAEAKARFKHEHVSYKKKSTRL